MATVGRYKALVDLRENKVKQQAQLKSLLVGILNWDRGIKVTPSKLWCRLEESKLAPHWCEELKPSTHS